MPNGAHHFGYKAAILPGDTPDVGTLTTLEKEYSVLQIPYSVFLHQKCTVEMTLCLSTFKQLLQMLDSCDAGCITVANLR